MTDRPNPRRIRQAMRDAIKAAAASIGSDGHGEGGLSGYLRALGMTEPSLFGPLLRLAVQGETDHPDFVEVNGEPATTAQEAMMLYQRLLADPRLLLGVPDVPQLPAPAVEPRKPASREPLQPRPRRPRRELHLERAGAPARAMPSDTRPAPQPKDRINHDNHAISMIAAADHGNAPPQQAAAASEGPPGFSMTPLRSPSPHINGTRPTPFEPPAQPQPERPLAEVQAEQTERYALRRHRLGCDTSLSAHAMRGSGSLSMSDVARPLPSPPALNFKVARDCLDSFSAFRKGGGRC